MKIIGIRDNICVKSQKVTCGSKILENFISPYNATVVEKLNEKDIETKKISMSEFGLEDDNYIGEFFANNNAISAIITTDLGGNVARDCVKNNLYGIKPSFGLVSRYGFISTAPSLEQISVIGKTADDCKELLDIIKGHDEKDSGSVDVIPANDASKPIHSADIKIIKSSETQIDILKYAKQTYEIISAAEASSNLGRFDGIRYGYRTENAKDWKEVYINTRQEGFGFNAKKKIIAGTFFLSVENKNEYYDKAQKVRTIIKREMEKIFEGIDVLVLPVSEGYECLANLTGRPALTTPDGQMLIGNYFEEQTLFNVQFTMKPKR